MTVRRLAATLHPSRNGAGDLLVAPEGSGRQGTHRHVWAIQYRALAAHQPCATIPAPVASADPSGRADLFADSPSPRGSHRVPAQGTDEAVRIGVVSDVPIGSGLGFPDGFSNRYQLIVDELARAGHELLVIPGLNPSGPLHLEDEMIQDEGATYLHISRGSYRWPQGRLRNRLKSIARVYWMTAGRTAWEKAASRALRDWSPDVVLALSPWYPILADLTPRRVPVALFAEEDLSPHRRGAPLQARPRWKEWLRTVLRPVPDVVVTISPTEKAWAADQYRRSAILTVPHALDLSYWSPVDVDAGPQPPDIMCAGNFSSERNFKGLDQIVRSLPPTAGRPLTVGVASFRPPPDDLLRSHGAFIHYLGAVNDLRPLYRGAKLSLVPAFTVTGVKTQILQAWAMGCPVVTTEAGAASVTGKNGVDLVAGRSPGEVAALVASVASNPDLAKTLSINGLSRVRRDFSEETVMAAMDQVLDTLTSGH